MGHWDTCFSFIMFGKLSGYPFNNVLAKNVYNDVLGSLKNFWSEDDARKYLILKMFCKFRKIYKKTSALESL